jgi:hypothetical protein
MLKATEILQVLEQMGGSINRVCKSATGPMPGRVSLDAQPLEDSNLDLP